MGVPYPWHCQLDGTGISFHPETSYPGASNPRGRSSGVRTQWNFHAPSSDTVNPGSRRIVACGASLRCPSAFWSCHSVPAGADTGVTGLLRRPEHPALLDFPGLGDLEVLERVAERGKEDPALAVHPLPDHRH